MPDTSTNEKDYNIWLLLSNTSEVIPMTKSCSEQFVAITTSGCFSLSLVFTWAGFSQMGFKKIPCKSEKKKRAIFLKIKLEEYKNISKEKIEKSGIPNNIWRVMNSFLSGMMYR